MIIIRVDGRGLHDVLAGTKVIDLKETEKIETKEVEVIKPKKKIKNKKKIKE
jgi:hypothetical protein